MKNKLSDLNDYLFAQLERLADEDLTGDAIATEIKRSEAVVQVADKIVDNARLQLAAVKFTAENGNGTSRLPATLAISAGASIQ
jgi:hypothetical protein